MPETRHELHDAVRRQDVAAVKALLAAGADANALDARGDPPLWYAITSGVGFVLEPTSRQIIRSLLDAGADPAVASVGERLVADAWSMVTHHMEASDVRALAEMLGVPSGEKKG
jgi:ankyrin repeat protein